MVRPAGAPLRRMADAQSEAKLEKLEKMMVGFHNQLARVQEEVASLTRAVDDIAKIEGEVMNLSNSVKGLSTLKSLIKHMVQRQKRTLDDSVLSDHQQGPPLDPQGLQQEHRVHPHKPAEVQPAVCGIELPIFDGPIAWLEKSEQDFELHETSHLQQAVASMENEDKEALPTIGKLKILRCGAEKKEAKNDELLGAQEAEWALHSGLKIGDIVNGGSASRQTWAQRNPKSPPIKLVMKLTLVSLKKTTQYGFSAVGRWIGPNWRQPRLTSLLGFDGRESIGWILGAGQRGTTTTILPAPPCLQIPLTEKAVDGDSAKYDVAVSTACPGLDCIIVETTVAAQACVELLRIKKLGVATFMILEKPVELMSILKEKVVTPGGVPRLFGLINLQDEKLKLAFYAALRNRVLAADIEQTTRIAYGGKKEFWRRVDGGQPSEF